MEIIWYTQTIPTRELRLTGRRRRPWWLFGWEQVEAEFEVWIVGINYAYRSTELRWRFA